MFSADDFIGVSLGEGFSIAQVTFVDEPIEDLFGKPAAGRTRIAHRELHIVIAAALSDREKSVTLYHEVLESMTVMVERAPDDVRDFGEADFEREGYSAFDRFGPVSPSTLRAMLQFYGFQRE
jgi:hypothetical protein